MPAIPAPGRDPVDDVSDSTSGSTTDGTSGDVRTLGPALQAAEQTYRRMLFETFAFELRLGHRLGFLRAFGSPRIAGLLASTGQIEHDTSRRGTDTGLFLYLMLHHGLDSPVGRRAVERVNAMHAAWSIPDDDYGWVLSNWFLPGLRIVEDYGWRPLTLAERRAVVDWHRELGVRMGVRGLPDSVEAFEKFAEDYERDNLRASDAGRRLRAAALDVASRSLPRPLRPLGGQLAAVLLDDPVRQALDLPRPRAVARVLVPAVLRARAAVRRRRRGPSASWFVPGVPRRDYPHGYTVEDLGPSDEDLGPSDEDLGPSDEDLGPSDHRPSRA